MYVCCNLNFKLYVQGEKNDNYFFFLPVLLNAFEAVGGYEILNFFVEIFKTWNFWQRLKKQNKIQAFSLTSFTLAPFQYSHDLPLLYT